MSTEKFFVMVDDRFYREATKAEPYPWTTDPNEAKRYETRAEAQALAEYFQNRGMSPKEVAAAVAKHQAGGNKTCTPRWLFDTRDPVTLGGVVCDTARSVGVLWDTDANRSFNDYPDPFWRKMLA